MQHLTISDKSLLIGDAVSELLLEYAALLGRIGSADTVRVHAIGADGDDVVTGLLLNEGTVLVTETSRSSLPEPDNAEVEAYLRDRITSFDFSVADPFAAADEEPADRSG